MADDASDYEVTVVFTFVDGLINTITCGIYTPSKKLESDLIQGFIAKMSPFFMKHACTNFLHTGG